MHFLSQVTTLNDMGENVGRVVRPNGFPQTIADSSRSAIIAFFIIGITSGAFLLSSDQINHWFLIPISICGVLMGTDAIDWFRGHLDLYDPVGLLGIFGVHFFFLAPLLHVKWDFWTGVGFPPPDWRDWLGYMGVLNVVGLICYRICRQTFTTRASSCRVFWEIDKTRFFIFVPLCLAASAAMQVWVYSRLGGIAGYMQSRLDNPSAFEGMGWVFMISESVPILAAFLIVVHLQWRKISWSRTALALLALFILQMVFGGLRGSRSETVLLFFWVVGSIHFFIRPVPRKLVLCGCMFLVTFMYLYGFYKAVGMDAIQAFSASEEREQLTQKTGRTSEALVLGDFARADMQAFILYRLINHEDNFTYAKGRTYLGALSLFVPRWILPDRPEGKLKEGTEIQIGTGGYVPGEMWSSKVYGLAGESMLNFSPLSVPFVYALFGLLVGRFRNGAASLFPGDARLLLVPFAVYMCLAALAGDSDNVTFGLVKNGFLPFLVVLVCSIRRRHFVPHPR